MKKELSKVYVNVIQEMYKSTNTKIISFYGEIEDFTVTVWMYQGLPLSAYLFSLVMHEIKMDIQNKIQLSMLFTYYIALVEESSEEVNSRLQEWRGA